MRTAVVIPLFNSSAYLEETVASVVAQTRSAAEIILVDDGSTDETAAVIERLARGPGMDCLRVVTQRNAGVAAARNAGIAAAHSDYILPLDADDLIAPEMLEKCAAVLDRDPAVSLVYTDRQDFGDISAAWPAGRFEAQRLKYFNQLSYCTPFRKAMWADLGGFRRNVSGFDDWDFWLAATVRGYRGHHLAEPLLRHRRRRGSQLWRLLDDYERLYAQIILNNSTIYEAVEIAAAERFLSNGAEAALLRASKAIFVGRYYAAYPAAVRQSPMLRTEPSASSAPTREGPRALHQPPG
jgi:glycosyltransferase involved in cell wall biosynthesis